MIRKENGREERTLHRNLLLPIGDLPIKHQPEELPIKRRSESVIPSVLEHTSEAQREVVSDDEEDEEDILLTHVETQVEDTDEVVTPINGNQEHKGADEAYDSVEDVLVEETRDEEREESEGQQEEEVTQEVVAVDQSDAEESTEDHSRLLPRRSKRISRQPKRYGNSVLTVDAQKPKMPIPLPRYSLQTHTCTAISAQSSPSVTSIPQPRHRNEQSKPKLLNSVLDIQEEQCRIHDVILNILQDT